MQESWEEIEVDGGRMSCFLAVPAGEGPFPGVVVCMHAPAVDGFIQNMARRLAEAGFVAIAPDLYHRDPASGDDPLMRMGRLRDDQLLVDLGAATGHLRGLPQVDGQRTASIGFCMGGRIAYLHATADAGLKAVVVFYGGNMLVPWGDGPSPFDRSGSIACPMLGPFGAEDKNPSPSDVARIDAHLTQLGKAHRFHSYPGAGHAFLNDSRPSYRPAAAAAAAAEAWGLCLTMLHQHLG
jgi:carboxymethylenebutenolidase